ncbi:MAG: GNAT family N-acetyltransferase [Gammaproteobacteria bacterium]|nr:MAG: GNAT family N-acetyltransferase [Gammaproteobacteria bacterium]
MGTQEVPDDEWDAFVAGHPEGHHEQCAGFARHRADYGFGTARVVIRDRGEIVAGAQLLHRRSRLGRLSLLLRGPLVSTRHAEAAEDIGKAILVHAKRRGYAGLRVELFPTQSKCGSDLMRFGWAPLPIAPAQRQSCVVSLQSTREALLASMHYNVRRYSGGHKGQAELSIHNVGHEGLETFHKLYAETSEFHGFPRFQLSYFRYLWDVFGQADKLYCLLASLHGQPVAAVLNTVVGSRMYYGWGGMLRQPEVRHAKPNYPLHLAAMDIARARGLTHYDLTGISPFKQQFVSKTQAWPAPLQQYFGPTARLRWCLARNWRQPLLGRVAARLERVLNENPRMPY